MGAGAVGCYFGARLAQAGHDVSLIARGAHLRAMQNHGLKIESALGGVNLQHVAATSDPSQVGHVDLVLFCAKLWDTEASGEASSRLLKKSLAGWNWTCFSR